MCGSGFGNGEILLKLRYMFKKKKHRLPWMNEIWTLEDNSEESSEGKKEEL